MALSKITAASITSNVITAAIIADGEITFADLANNTITGAKIAPTTITGDKIGLTAITGNLVAAAAITGDKIGLTAITSNLIASGVTLTSPVIASANLITALTLAGATGNNGQVLTSAGSGLPTWATPGGGATFNLDDFNRQDQMIVSRFAMSEECVRFVAGKFFLNESFQICKHFRVGQNCIYLR